MIRNSRTEAAEGTLIAGKDARSCWGARERIAGVRFENAEATSAVLFPYTHLERAEWRRDFEGEKLHVHFSSHSVRVVGRNLRELLSGFQEMQVEWVRPIPQKFVPILLEGTAVVISWELQEHADLHR
jgi:hypothetical protein